MAIENALKTVLSLAEFWAALGERKPAEFLVDLCATCKNGRLRSLKPLQQITSTWSATKDIETNHAMQSVVGLLQETLRFLTISGSRSSLETVNSVLGALNHCQHMEPSVFLEKLRQALTRGQVGASTPSANDDTLSLEDYVDKLSGAIGRDEDFVSLYKRLESDRQMTRESVVQIASSIAFKMAKSTSRKVALARIWEQHETSQSTGAKIRANDGRSAA